MKYTPRAVTILLCCTLALNMAACDSTTPDSLPPSAPASTPAPTPAVEVDDRLYSIYLGNETLTFDSAGNIIPRGEQFSTVYDVLTDEPMLLIRTRTEVENKRDENGYPITHKLTALYDLDGKLLHDWGEYAYERGFGDYIIRTDSKLYDRMIFGGTDSGGDTALWNYKTGKDIMKDVYQIKKLDDHSALVEGMRGTLMGIMETGGGEPVFRPAPAGCKNPQAWYGYILADDAETFREKDRPTTLMDRSFKPIFTAMRVNGGYVGLRGRYMLANGSDERRVVIDEKGDTVFAPTDPEEDVDYFDGELALVDKVDAARSNQETTQEVAQPDGTTITYISVGQRVFIRRLVKADGTELAGGYSRLFASDRDDYETEQPAPCFVGIKDNTVNILDRTGSVTATREIPGIDSIQTMRDGLYAYTLLPPSRELDANGKGADGYMGLLDSELNPVMPADKYTYIEECYSRSGGKSMEIDLLRCRKTASGGAERWDIVDFSGNVLIENLTQVGDAGPNRIAAVKGFNVGLMDLQGNWIAKQSIFDGLEDEKEDFF